MATRFIGALSISEDVSAWLVNTRQPRILHVFEQACNLINEQGQLLSIVTPQIGNGPFNLVIDEDTVFLDDIHVQSVVSNNLHQLTIGSISINITRAKLWNARPDWEMLHSRRVDILVQLIKLASANFEYSKSPVTSLLTALAQNNISVSVRQSSQLAGLGVGLTPSGDDYIMGALYAAWIIHPQAVAQHLARAVAATAAPLTTSLSAAWLRSAGKGEAGIMWHTLLDALVSDERSAVQFQINNILSFGATSGPYAMSGFIDTFISYAESEKNHVIPKFLHR